MPTGTINQVIKQPEISHVRSIRFLGDFATPDIRGVAQVVVRKDDDTEFETVNVHFSLGGAAQTALQDYVSNQALSQIIPEVEALFGVTFA
jgi:hypothetical protein